MSDQPKKCDIELNRREFLTTSIAVGVVSTIPDIGYTSTPDVPISGGIPMIEVQMKVNGESKTLKIDSRTTLLDALRENMGLIGSKKGCDHGQCGACTVLVNGQRINSCLSLAVLNQGAEITTIEGLAKGEKLHPMQKAFIDHDAFQCGYCTPGQIMSAVALMKEPCGHSEAEVRECMSGNICRCGAYRNILDAIKEVRGKGASHATV